MSRPLPGGQIGRELQRMLFAGEQVMDYAQGKANQTLIATNMRAIVIKGALGSGGLWGTNVSTFPYAQLTSVDMRKGFVDGYVEISAGGMQGVQRGRVGQVKANNIVPFNKWDEAAFVRIVQTLQWYVQQAHMPQMPQIVQMSQPMLPPPPPPPSIPQQIQQLAQLHDQGVLTDEEFTTKKAELLSRM